MEQHPEESPEQQAVEQQLASNEAAYGLVLPDIRALPERLAQFLALPVLDESAIRI